MCSCEHGKKHNTPCRLIVSVGFNVQYLDEEESLLQESGLVLVLHVGSELDLSLDSCELTGFIKGDRVGSIQYIIPSLEETWGGGKKREGKWEEDAHIQEEDTTTKAGELSEIHAAELRNELSLCALNAPWLQRRCLLSEWLSV